MNLDPTGTRNLPPRDNLAFVCCLGKCSAFYRSFVDVLLVTACNLPDYSSNKTQANCQREWSNNETKVYLAIPQLEFRAKLEIFWSGSVVK